MKKDLVIQIAVMVAALAAASILALRLTPMQNAMFPGKAKLTQAPIGGMQKFSSDIKWMTLINYIGSKPYISPADAKELAKRFETMIRLDPNFDRLYQQAIPFMLNADPQKTMTMLEDACKEELLQSNWEIPFYIGFVYSNPVYDVEDQNRILMQPDFVKAVQYFGMAIERSGSSSPVYLINNYIRAKIRLESTKYHRPDAEIFAQIKILFDEWCKVNIPPVLDKLSPVDTANDPMPEFFIENLDQRLLTAIQSTVHPVNGNGETITIDPETTELVKTVQSCVFSGVYLCDKCFHPAASGDKFCKNCGAEFKKIIGICSKCAAILPDGAKFCTSCGQPVMESQPPSDAPARQ